MNARSTAAKMAIPLLLAILSLFGCSKQVPPTPSARAPSQGTLFVDCKGDEKPKHVLSPVSISEGEDWRAYVEVEVQPGCLLTTRLWIARGNGGYRMVYLMPPMRDASENGMEILGWANNSRMVLVRTEKYQSAGDAVDTQQVLAIDAATGEVYEPELEAMVQLPEHKDKQCLFRLTDAGFSADRNVNILVRAQFSTALDVDETEEDVPPAKRCGKAEETWSFNFATGEIKQVTNVEALLLFKKFLPNPLRDN